LPEQEEQIVAAVAKMGPLTNETFLGGPLWQERRGRGPLAMWRGEERPRAMIDIQGHWGRYRRDSEEANREGGERGLTQKRITTPEEG